MNPKALKSLEYYKIIEQLTDKASSSMGKELCQKLLPSEDIYEIRHMQIQTRDALTRLFQKGNISFGSVKDVRGSLKRVLLAVVSILIVSAITFFVMNIIPGGPFNKEKATSAEAQKVLEERYNLDKPIPEQYVIYMNNLLHGDWGVSLHSGRDIWG